MVDVQKVITGKAWALEEKLRALEKRQRRNDVSGSIRPDSSPALPSQPAALEDSDEEVEEGEPLSSLVDGLRFSLAPLLEDLQVFEASLAEESARSHSGGPEASVRPLPSLTTLPELDLDHVAPRQQGLVISGPTWDDQARTNLGGLGSASLGASEAERQLRRLEDQGASVLEGISRLRQRLQSASVGLGGAYHGGTLGTIAASVAVGSLASGASGFRELRVFLARLETLFLTSWVDELQRASRILQHRNGAPLPPSCNMASHSSGPTEPGSASLMALLQARHSELQDLARRMPSAQNRDSG